MAIDAEDAALFAELVKRNNRGSIEAPPAGLQGMRAGLLPCTPPQFVVHGGGHFLRKNKVLYITIKTLPV